MNIISILSEILLLFIYVILGLYIKKRQFVTETGIQEISKIVVNVAMPLLVISSVNIEYKPEYANNMLLIAVLSFLYLATVTITSKKLASLVTDDKVDRSSMRYALVFGNIVFLGYPLSYALFGDVGVLYASVYVAMQNIFQWTLGVHFFSTDKFKMSNLKKLLNPGLIAICIGLTLLFLGIQTPPYILRIIKGVGAISVPLALMMIGATLADFRIKEIFTDKRAQFVAFFKSIVFPALFLFLLMALPIDKTLKSVLVIMAAAPVQASATVIAHNFGGDSIVVAKCVALTTTLCALTLPAFLLLI